MNFRFYIDPTSGLQHIYNHSVNEDEVEQALSNRGEDRPGSKDSRIAIGQTDAGRYLRVIYVQIRNQTACLLLQHTNSAASR